MFSLMNKEFSAEKKMTHEWSVIIGKATLHCEIAWVQGGVVNPKDQLPYHKNNPLVLISQCLLYKVKVFSELLANKPL